MARKTEEVVTCDHCGKEIRMPADGSAKCGGNPLAGWFHVQTHRGRLRVGPVLHQDFCSADCVLASVRKEEGDGQS